MKNLNEVVDKFQEQGYKITPQRREVFNILVNNKTHPKAEEIYAELEARMPDVSLATVYNTLNILEELGMIDAINIVGDDSVHYDPNTEPHDHLYCICCHRIVDIPKDRHDPHFSEEELLGFRIIKRHVTYYGYCPNCREGEDIQ